MNEPNSIKLTKGIYLGSPVLQFASTGVIIGINEYNSDTCWHEHENSYFSYMIRGGNVEVTNETETECSAGSLLYCAAQKRHKNIRYRPRTRILHVEMDQQWNSYYDLKPAEFPYRINDLNMQRLFAGITAEVSFPDACSRFMVESFVLQALVSLDRSARYAKDSSRGWSQRLKIFLAQVSETPSLTSAAKAARVHPVTLSREFKKHFGCTFRDYVQKKKLQDLMPMLAKKSIPLESIALDYGFSSTSHLIRMFRKHYGTTPDAYRKETLTDR